MNAEQRKMLLRTAKQAVEAAVQRRSMPQPQSGDPDLNERCGCFVTLKSAGRLRGCIGQFTGDQPLIELVARMAQASSTQDSRFFHDPIRPGELTKLNIEISVLSPLQRTQDPLSLRLGVDGVYIIRGGRSGCFLPQVVEETGWNKEKFLSYCCAHKAMLPPDAWKDPATEVYLFTVEAFNADWTDIK